MQREIRDALSLRRRLVECLREEKKIGNILDESGKGP